MKLYFTKVFLCFVLLTISISYADTQEELVANISNTRVSVYFHPFSTYLAIIGASPVYLTAEIPFSLYNSLIIKPSFLNISNIDVDGYGDKAFRIGSDIGFRHYLTGKGEGFYLQGQMGVFYFRHDHFSDGECDVVVTFIPFYTVYIPRKSLWLDAMGYAGYSWKDSHVSAFIDVGFGVITGISTETGYFKLDDELWPDLNIGIGISF